MTNGRRTHSAEHQEVSALIPWYVNDTLEDRDCQRVTSHLASCSSCRDDLAAQRRIYEAIDAQPSVDYVPAASLKRLLARIDTQSAESPPVTAPAALPRSSAPNSWRTWMAASVAGLAVALGLFAGDHWLQAERLEPNYRTVTISASRPSGEVIRAVFSPTITLVELQGILDEAQLKIVSGPTEAGVYSLASNSTLTVRASLALLRQHSTVRFAEETAPETESGRSP
jgi:predicted anti-sigma-YlaC factor YlaD